MSRPRLLPGAGERLKAPFDSLAAALGEAGTDRLLVFMQNDGNYGDALIRFGTKMFFEDYGFEFVERDMSSRVQKASALLGAVRNRFLRDRLHVYSGSGAWSSFTSLGRCNVLRQLAFGAKMFVLPTTFQDTGCGFGRLNGATVFVRDRDESAVALPGRPFCHDMAFYLALINPARVLPNRTPPTNEIGVLFRTDNEGRPHGWQNLPQNRDLSAEGNHAGNIDVFLREVDRFHLVITDRLHVAIAALILGKEVVIASGRYFKIRAIHRSSIADNFNGVQLLESDEELDRTMVQLGISKPQQR